MAMPPLSTQGVSFPIGYRAHRSSHCNEIDQNALIDRRMV